MELIRKLSRNEHVYGLAKLKFEKNHFCACQMDKQITNSCKLKNIIITSRLLHILHLNLFGPTKTSLRGTW